MKTFFEFKSEQFQPTPGELNEESDTFINPGLFAKELSTWLCLKLTEKGWSILRVVLEDWGHWIELETDGPKSLALCCGQQYADHHIIFTDPSKPVGRRSLFRTYDLTAEMTRLVADIESALRNDADIQITDIREA